MRCFRFEEYGGCRIDSKRLSMGLPGSVRRLILAGLSERKMSEPFHTPEEARPTVESDWIAKSLAIWHSDSVSRLVGKVKRDTKLKRRANELENISQCGA